MKAPNRISYNYMKTQRTHIMLWICQAGTTFLFPLPCCLYDLILIRMLEEKEWKHEVGRTDDALLPELPPADFLDSFVDNVPCRGTGWAVVSEALLFYIIVRLPKRLVREICKLFMEQELSLAQSLLMSRLDRNTEHLLL